MVFGRSSLVVGYWPVAIRDSCTMRADRQTGADFG